MPAKPILVSGPSITEREVEYVTEAARNAWFENANTFNQRFEQLFASVHAARYAISLPSCTSALHLSLAALGVGPGDEVIVPDCTWIASAAPISYVGAQPVFADIYPDSWCIDAGSLSGLISSRTRAIIAVDLYGDMPDYAALQELAAHHNIPIIEDAAEAIGSRWRGTPAGRMGITGTFSFHGSKTVTTGEGGMLITDDEAIYRRCLFLRDHGRPPGDTLFQNDEVAFKYKMSSMQAAMGLAQLERLEELITRKRKIFSWYAERLGQHPSLILNRVASDVVNSFWMVTVLIPEGGPDKHEVMRRLAAEGIHTRPFFNPLSSLNAYAMSPDTPRARKANTVSYSVSKRGINLPSGLQLDEATVDFVTQALVQAVGAA